MDFIPIFPLGLVAFPGELIRLHIFEPRYKQLIHDCSAQHISFGITPYIEGKKLDIGTEVSLKEITKVYEDGKMDILVQGARVFDVLEVMTKLQDREYPGANIEFRQAAEPELSDELIREVKDQIGQLYEIMKLKLDHENLDLISSMHTILHKIGLSIEQEKEILGLETNLLRLSYVNSHLSDLLPVVKELEQMRQKVKLNGHVKSLLPPDLQA